MTHHETDLDLTHALAQVTVPACVLDDKGRIQWLNRGAIDIVGDRIGQPFAWAIAPEDLHLARAQFAKKLIGEARSTEYNLTVLSADGRRVTMRVSSVPLYADGAIVGVFGVCYPVCGTDGATAAPSRAADTPELTARQYETLALLADGLGTAEIALRLGVAEETARNHIRGLLRQLGVHSRLEAVVAGYRIGLLQSGEN
jgi:PAS domain S-box-containing protein